jgi:hypothetical protein
MFSLALMTSPPSGVRAPMMICGPEWGVPLYLRGVRPDSLQMWEKGPVAGCQTTGGSKTGSACCMAFSR